MKNTDLDTAYTNHENQLLDKAVAQLMQLAEQSRLGGDIQKAQECYRLLLTSVPDDAEAHFQLGQLLSSSAEALEAVLPHYEAAIQASPNTAKYWDAYIDVLRKGNNLDAVTEALSLKATFISPEKQNVEMRPASKPVAFVSKSVVSTANADVERLVLLYQQGELQQLEKFARQLIKKNKHIGFAYRFLGIALLDSGRLSDAVSAMKKALVYLPNDPIAHFNFALACVQAKDFINAELHYRHAIRIQPTMLPALNNLGNLLSGMGCLDEAETIIRHLIALDPSVAAARINLVNILKRKNDLPLALIEARKAVEATPQFANAQNALGGILYTLKHYDEALVHFKKAIELQPQYAEAYSNIGTIFFNNHEYLEAKPYFEKALSIDPNLSSAYRLLASLGSFIGGDSKQIETQFRKALALDPSDHLAHTALLFQLCETGQLAPKELLAEHKKFSEKFETPFIPFWPKHQNEKVPERMLRVGFVSGDLCNHAVASFITPVLEHLSRNNRLQLYAYNNSTVDDFFTQKIQTYFYRWNSIQDYSDAHVAQKIQDDQIDILCDLSGHTSKNRLLVFARKPAPVQFSWIGYPGTTGLKAMDYYVTDKYLVPENEAEDQFIEKIVQLPVSAPFLPYEQSPEVQELPALKTGNLVFGSFNRINKISGAVVKVWAKVLLAVPSSQLFLGAMPQSTNVQDLITLFENEGVARGRLISFGRCGMTMYLEQLNKVDICLDTFPYNGATTTLHGVWMGVPTLTMRGNSLTSRLGQAILAHMGVVGFDAENEDDFAAKAVFWSKNLPQLAQLRMEMRQRLIDSGYMRADKIADSLDQAMRSMWQKWCAGEPPKSMTIE